MLLSSAALLAAWVVSPVPTAPLVSRRSAPLMAAEQRVAIVTGASRGIGKGIAVELGREGFAVYATGRSTRADGATTERDLPPDVTDATIDATAEEITALGGRGVAARVDHNDDAAFKELVDRVERDEGRLDVLVYSAFVTPPSLDTSGFRAPFWEQGAPMWDAIHGVGLRSAYLACCDAAPLLIKTAAQKGRPPPVIVLVSSFGGRSYIFNVAYGVQKAAVDRLALDMHQQLKSLGVRTIALYPGVVRTEGNVELERQGKWAQASGGIDLGSGETPGFSGRAVATLCNLPADEIEKRSGQVQVVAELARELDFCDIDGRQPPSIRSLAFILPNFVFPKIEAEGGTVPDWMRENVPDWKIPWFIFSSAPPPAAED